jgi:DNA-binding XRE family transcriptional regulator
VEREEKMARKLDQVLDSLPAGRRAKIEERAAELATLKDLRQAMQKTQEELAAALHIGQDSVSRLEKRSDMLLSTLRGYVEAMGGKLELVAHFPNRPPVVIEHLVDKADSPKANKGGRGGEAKA